MTERLAYLIFVNAVGTVLGLFTVGLAAILFVLVRQHRRAKQQ